MFWHDRHDWGETTRRGFRNLILCSLLTLYLCVSAMLAVVMQPHLSIIFILPILPLILWAAPKSREVPRWITRRLIYLAAFLTPLWPVYLHIKLGPLPIVTPTRIVIYSILAIWVYEMACVPWRRKMFLAAAGRLKPVFWVIIALFIMKFLSVPFAEGKAVAGKEFIRHAIIWLVPFLALVTYIKTRADLDLIVTLIIGSSLIVACIALLEYATQTTLAEVLAPVIGKAPWLTAIIEAKIRDGVFRSQATHTHPLSLGEHLAMVIPFAMYKFYRGGQTFIGGTVRTRIMYAAVVFLLVGSALMANSRGALIGGVLAFSLTSVMMGIAWSQTRKAYAYRPLIGLVFVYAMILSPVVLGIAWQITKGEEGSTAERSSQARIDQFEMAWPKFLARPLLGYGNGRAVAILGYYGEQLSIDNYYLNLALEVGALGPILFLLSFIIMAVIGYRWGSKLPEDPYSGLYFAFTGMAICFATTRLILSITINIELFMFLSACFIGSSGAVQRKLRAKKRLNVQGYQPFDIAVTALQDCEPIAAPRRKRAPFIPRKNITPIAPDFSLQDLEQHRASILTRIHHKTT